MGGGGEQPEELGGSRQARRARGRADAKHQRRQDATAEREARKGPGGAYRRMHRGFEVRGPQSEDWTEETLLDTAKRYAREVATGRWPACLWTRLAMRRFQEDLRRQRETSFPFRLDMAKAVRAAWFMEMCRLTAGDDAGKGHRLRLMPWQVFVVVNLFGWVRKGDPRQDSLAGKRRFTEAYLKLPRKTGKSEFAAALGLFMLAADGEFGAQCFSGARTLNDAYKVFKPATVMVRRDRELQKHGLQAWGGQKKPDEITYSKTFSSFIPLIGKPGDGDNPHFYACDEYHQHKTDEQYAAMKTGMSNRSQPLLLVITTAGSDLSAPCFAHEESAKKLLQGDYRLDSWFVLIYGLDTKAMSEDGVADDWKSTEAIEKANHSIGFSQNIDRIVERLDEAIAKGGTLINDYKTKYLNIWVGSREAYFPMEKWNASAAPRVKRPANAPEGWQAPRHVDIMEWRGRRIFWGLDLADKIDLCSLMAYSEADDGISEVWGRHWLPEETILGTPPGHHYRRWADEGWLQRTEGAMIDGRRIAAEIIELFKTIGHDQLAYDPWHAAGVIPILQEHRRIKLIEIGNSPSNMSDPMQTLRGLIKSGKLRHPGDPVLTWSMGNVVAKPSANARDLAHPHKNTPDLKIDPAVALMMAMAVELKAPAAPRGPRVVRLA